MKLSIVSAISVLICSAASAVTNQFLHLGRLVPPFEDGDEFPVASASAVNATGSSFFTQLLDHDDPSKGTFQQKFWWNAEYWAGPGSPIVFFTPGILCSISYAFYLLIIYTRRNFRRELWCILDKVRAPQSLSLTRSYIPRQPEPASYIQFTFETSVFDPNSATITGLYAQEIKGAVVMVERELPPEAASRLLHWGPFNNRLCPAPINPLNISEYYTYKQLLIVNNRSILG
jgi:hypothetical protein